MITDTCRCGASVRIEQTLSCYEREAHREWMEAHAGCRMDSEQWLIPENEPEQPDAQPPAIVPSVTRCRGCQSYRQSVTAYTGVPWKYCNEDGLYLRPDSEPCSEYQPKTHQDITE